MVVCVVFFFCGLGACVRLDANGEPEVQGGGVPLNALEARVGRRPGCADPFGSLRSRMAGCSRTFWEPV